MLIDTHTHLYLSEFSPLETEAVDRAVSAGVDKMIFPNVDKTTVEPMKKLHEARPQVTAIAIGLHPTEVNDEDAAVQTAFVELELLSDDAYVAIGEIGVDLYWDKTFADRQMQVFEHQLKLAEKYNLPVIIHCREALDEILEVMEKFGNRVPSVFHSFGGSVDDVEKIRRVTDCFFGINGIVTFKNSGLAKVLPVIGSDRILLETDSPYLTPVPHRGKRNESAYIIHTAAKVADSFGVSMEEIGRITSDNARKLFTRL